MAAKKRKPAVELAGRPKGIDDIIKAGGKLAKTMYKKEVDELGGEAVVKYLKNQNRKGDEFLEKVRKAGGLDNYLKRNK